MSKTLYIEKMLALGATKEQDPNQYPSGVVDIWCPNASVNISKDDPNRGSRMMIRAILESDIRFSIGNKWGNLIELGTELSDTQQALNLGNHNLFHWISASSVGWKGSEPLTITFTCYLVTVKSPEAGQISIKEQALSLISLAALYVNMDDNPVIKNATVKVHGGYEPRYFTGNADLIGDNTHASDNLNKASNILPSTSLKDMYTSGGDDTGLISVTWGGPQGPNISGLLLEKCEVEVSSVMCAPGIPLWIKLTPQLRTFRSLTTKDVSYLLGEKI